MKSLFTLFGLGALVAAAPGAAQQPSAGPFAELRAGAVVPTFDIADVATSGGAFGLTLGYHLNDRWLVMGEFDYAGHEDEPTGLIDINTLHYLGKVGYSLTGPRDRGWEAVVNLGAGAVTFDVDGAPEQYTYFAINAGAKLTYHLNQVVAVVLSPQGDIAFSKESEVGTNNAWVWPFSAGVRMKF